MQIPCIICKDLHKVLEEIGVLISKNNQKGIKNLTVKLDAESAEDVFLIKNSFDRMGYFTKILQSISFNDLPGNGKDGKIRSHKINFYLNLEWKNLS